MEVDNMNYNDESLLEMIELYAESQGYVDSEEALSEQFDNDIMPAILHTYGKPGEAFDDDTMVSEEFNNWSDGICKDGEIHPIQYDQYCYVGKYT